MRSLAANAAELGATMTSLLVSGLVDSLATLVEAALLLSPSLLSAEAVLRVLRCVLGALLERTEERAGGVSADVARIFCSAVDVTDCRTGLLFGLVCPIAGGLSAPIVGISRTLGRFIKGSSASAAAKGESIVRKLEKADSRTAKDSH
jgi:hypothetical protein